MKGIFKMDITGIKLINPENVEETFRLTEELKRDVVRTIRQFENLILPKHPKAEFNTILLNLTIDLLSSVMYSMMKANISEETTFFLINNLLRRSIEEMILEDTRNGEENATNL